MVKKIGLFVLSIVSTTVILHAMEKPEVKKVKRLTLFDSFHLGRLEKSVKIGVRDGKVFIDKVVNKAQYDLHYSKLFKPNSEKPIDKCERLLTFFLSNTDALEEQLANNRTLLDSLDSSDSKEKDKENERINVEIVQLSSSLGKNDISIALLRYLKQELSLIAEKTQSGSNAQKSHYQKFLKKTLRNITGFFINNYEKLKFILHRIKTYIKSKKELPLS